MLCYLVLQVMVNGRENPFAKAEFRSRIRKTVIFIPFSPNERHTVASLVRLSPIIVFYIATQP